MYDQGYERTTELFVIPCDYYRYEMIIIVIIIVTIEFEKEPFSKAWNPISERGRYALKVTAQKKKTQNKTKQNKKQVDSRAKNPGTPPTSQRVPALLEWTAFGVVPL